jgi:hypothetical protein
VLRRAKYHGRKKETIAKTCKGKLKKEGNELRFRKGKEDC